MANTSITKDYSQYNERQLFNFLNTIDKQLIKAEIEQRKAIEKFKEIQAKKQMIRQALAEKFKESHITENGYTQEQELEILASANSTENTRFNNLDEFKEHCENLKKDY